MKVLVLREAQIRALVSPRQSLEAVRDAFARLGRGEATLPGVIGLDLPERRGEVHVKGAWLHGTPFFSIKEAAGFYDNPARGLPVGSGLVLVFDAETGALRAILFDNGYLTELRTGSAGALSADLLARERVERAGIVGCGSQARYQLEALLTVRRPRTVRVFGRDADKRRLCAAEMRARFGLDVEAVGEVREAVERCDVVITATPSRAPLVRADWVGPGTHITAVGSDGPEKQELDPALLAKAKVVADRLEQCLRLGEIHHAVAAGLMKPRDVYAELGELAAGLKPGRASEDEITVADLTGVGVQDAAVANFVMAEALRRGMGESLEV